MGELGVESGLTPDFISGPPERAAFAVSISPVRFDRAGLLASWAIPTDLHAKHWKPWMLQWGKMPPHPSVYIRRELFGQYGLYKLGYDIAADYELLIRYLRMAKLNTRYLNECLVRMRMGGKSTRGWKSFKTLNKEIVRGNRENGYFCCFPMLLPKYLFKIFEFIFPRLGSK